MKKNQKTTIICTAPGSGEMLFFAENSTERIFLFRTNYYDRRIEAFYGSGISLDSLIRIRCAKYMGCNSFGRFRFRKVRDHVLRVLRDYEREAGVPIFRQMKKRKDAIRRSAA